MSNRQRHADVLDATISLVCKQKELVGLAEAAELAGVARQTLWTWKKFYDTFPKPITVLKATPVWYKEDITSWIAARQEAKETLRRVNPKKKRPDR